MISSYIDHTRLDPCATEAEIKRLCEEASAHKFFAVCTASTWTELCVSLAHNFQVCAVIGFPLGNQSTEAKAQECQFAISKGAHEIDMVINQGWGKSGRWDLVEEEIRHIVRVCRPKLNKLKVILECSNLDDAGITAACLAAARAGADFVKTSTGFSSRGANLNDIAVMKKAVGDRMGIKASGGIRDLAAAQAMISAGATRIGTSSGVSMLHASSAPGTSGKGAY